MAEVRSLNALRANRENDNSLLTPLECLEDAAADIRSGQRKCQKLLILCLDAGDDGMAYALSFFASNMKSSEMVALCEAMKARTLRNMDLI
jgi:hypothetical protein